MGRMLAAKEKGSRLHLWQGDPQDPRKLQLGPRFAHLGNGLLRRLHGSTQARPRAARAPLTLWPADGAGEGPTHRLQVVPRARGEVAGDFHLPGLEHGRDEQSLPPQELAVHGPGAGVLREPAGGTGAGPLGQGAHEASREARGAPGARTGQHGRWGGPCPVSEWHAGGVPPTPPVLQTVSLLLSAPCSEPWAPGEGHLPCHRCRLPTSPALAARSEPAQRFRFCAERYRVFQIKPPSFPRLSAWKTLTAAPFLQLDFHT